MTVNARNGLLKLSSRWHNEAVVNPKEILILNLMPTKEATEWQFLQRLRETGIDCGMPMVKKSSSIMSVWIRFASAVLMV